MVIGEDGEVMVLAQNLAEAEVRPERGRAITPPPPTEALTAQAQDLLPLPATLKLALVSQIALLHSGRQLVDAY